MCYNLSNHIKFDLYEILPVNANVNISLNETKFRTLTIQVTYKYVINNCQQACKDVK